MTTTLDPEPETKPKRSPLEFLATTATIAANCLLHATDTVRRVGHARRGD